jgi:hypothetical protein
MRDGIIVVALVATAGLFLGWAFRRISEDIWDI